MADGTLEPAGSGFHHRVIRNLAYIKHAYEVKTVQQDVIQSKYKLNTIHL